MAKIICITTGLTGILNASFELVAHLKKTGHEVAYASPRKVANRVEQEGITFFQLPMIPEDASPPLPVFTGIFKKIKRFFYKIQHSRSRQIATLNQTFPKEFAALLDKEKPDLLLIDIELHEYIFHAYSKNQKFVLLSQWFTLWKGKDLPYLLTDTIPGQGWKGTTLMIAFDWWLVKIRRWWIFTKKKMLSGGTDRRSALKALASKANFPLSLIKENYWPGPFTYSELPVISMTALEMEFPHQARPNLMYVGPMVYEQRQEKVIDNTIDEIISLKNRTGKKLLYCSVSTLSKGDTGFIKKIITSVQEEKEWLLIVGMGGLNQAAQWDNLPDNVHLFSYVPQLKVLKEADLSINHGGIHTINECIHFEVPMLVYSGKRSDQNGCAARVAYHQLGLIGDKDKEDSTLIKSKINKVLESATFKQNISSLNNRLSYYKEEGRLEKLIGV